MTSMFSITHFISSFSYFGVAFLMAIESAAIPLPSEIIMPFAGFLVSTGQMTLLGIAIAGAIGSTVGSIILYYIGYLGGRPLIEKYGKYVLMHKKDMQMAENFFNKYGQFSTFIGRILPIVRTFISLPAGIYKVEVKAFIFYSLVGSFIWSFLLGYVGLKFGDKWSSISGYFKGLDYIIAGLIILGIAAYIYRHVHDHHKENRKQ